MPIPGSAPNNGLQPRWSSAVNPNETASATITLRRRADSAAAAMEQQLLSGQAQPLAREQAAEQLSADPRDMTAVLSFVDEQGLTTTQENAAARTIKVEGTVEQMERAFGTQMGWVEDSAGNRHLSYQGALSIPQSLAGIITSVIGLDQRPIAKQRAAE